jgi:hypothetical protein
MKFTLLSALVIGSVLAKQDFDTTVPKARVQPVKNQLFVGWDRVRVVSGEEQGTFSNGDEPVLCLLKIKATTGTTGSTRVSWVHNSPGEIASGVDNNQEVNIPNEYGDAWTHIKPFDLDSLGESSDGLVHVDVGLTIGFALEGDLTVGQQNIMFLNNFLQPISYKVGKALEELRVPVTDVLKLDLVEKALKELLDKIDQAVDVDFWKVLSALPGAFTRWAGSLSDPDDVIGLGLTAFVPVADGFLDALKELGVKPKALGLNDQWTKKGGNRVDLGAAGYIYGEGWVGLLDSSWQDMSLTVASRFLHQTDVNYRFHLTAAVRD